MSLPYTSLSTPSIDVPAALRSKKSIHVFASDFLPYPGCPRTAGANRSQQLILALREAGHDVTFSMPLTNYLGKKNAEHILSSLDREQLWACEHFYEPNVVLNRIQPDVAVFCNINMFRPIARFSKDVVMIVDCYGPLQFEGLLIDTADYELAMRDGSLLEERCRQLVDQMRNIDYLVTVSERQKYFWSAYCSLAGFSFNELNVLVCPAAFEITGVDRQVAPNLTVVYSGGFYPWQNPDRFLLAAASILEKIEGATLHIFGGPHAGLPNETSARDLLNRLQRFQCVQYHGYRPVEELTATLSTAWCALELMERNIERELAITGRTVEFLSLGTPVIYNDYSTLSQLIKGYRAGWTVSTDDSFAGLESVFAELSAGGTALVGELSENARTLAATEFVPEKCMAPLVGLCKGYLPKRSSAHHRKSLPGTRGKDGVGRVLAISPSNGPLRELRIDNPLRALHRQGLISGFKTTDIWLSNLKDDETVYESILVQRAVPIAIYQALKNLSLPFILDVDDNLLARAEYRRNEKPETEILTGLDYCSILTVPNPRLAMALERYSCLSLASKTFVAPNSLPFPREFPSRNPTRPSQILWIQSDIAALTSSKEAVVSAVEQFSLKQKLPIVLIGPSVLEQPTFTNQISMGEVDFVSNLQMLQFMPTSIGVAPLETHADHQTLDFVAGKSDLKMLLFAGYGHPSVYSAAPPYTDSALSTGLSLVNNTYREWLEALESQFQSEWQDSGRIALNIQSTRTSEHVARESWYPALKSCSLPRSVRGVDLYEAYQSSAKMTRDPASTVAYLLGNRDVLDHCLRHEDASAAKHYSDFGRAEGRRLLHSPEAQYTLVQDLERENEKLLRREFEHVPRTTETPQRELVKSPGGTSGAIAFAAFTGPKDSAPFGQSDEGQIVQGRGPRDRLIDQLEGESSTSVDHLTKEVSRLNEILYGILRSKSWRLTAPLRSWAQKLK